MGLRGKTMSGVWTVGVICLLLVFGCSQGGEKLAEVDGVWQSDAGQQELSIHLNGDAKSITYGGDSVPVKVKKVEADHIILEAGKTAGGAVSEWKLTKVWNDNGSSFSLRLIHGDKVERFERKS